MLFGSEQGLKELLTIIPGGVMCMHKSVRPLGSLEKGGVLSLPVIQITT